MLIPYIVIESPESNDVLDKWDVIRVEIVEASLILSSERETFIKYCK